MTVKTVDMIALFKYSPLNFGEFIPITGSETEEEIKILTNGGNSCSVYSKKFGAERFDGADVYDNGISYISKNKVALVLRIMVNHSRKIIAAQTEIDFHNKKLTKLQAILNEGKK